MTVTSSIPGFPATYLPQKVVEVSRDAVRSFQHSKKVGNYLLGKTIGEGSFAKVKEALHIPTGERVAIKVVDKKRVKEDTYVRKNLRREGKILQLIRHHNIVQLFEIMETENSYYLVTELCKGGDLMDYICQRKRLEEREVKRYIRQVISALEYLHRLGILHRDLKVENLLLDENRDIKIIDFGLSNTIKVASSKETVRAHEFLTTQCGSPAYAAPELLGRKKYGPQVDVWSIGVNMYAMLTGNLPFTVEPFNIKTLYNKMLLGQTNPLPDFVSRECRDLLKRFLTPEPERRITLLEAMKHPWIAESSSIPMERSPCPNKLRSEELDENILKHMSESQGFRMSEVIRFVTGNVPSPAVAMYHILHRKLTKYMADMRVKGKVSALDSQIFGPKKVAVVFQKINSNRRNSTGSSIYQSSVNQKQGPTTAFQNKKTISPPQKKEINATEVQNDDVKITDIENDDAMTDSTKENNETERSQPKQVNCKTPVIIRRTKEHTQLPLVTAKVVTKYTTTTGSTKQNDADDVDSGIEVKGDASDTSDSKSTLNRRSNYRPHMMSPRRVITRGMTFQMDDTFPAVDKFENKENHTRPVMKRCNTDLSITAKSKPRFQRPCHPETIVHQMCNGQNNDYIRRTEVKVVNNKKLIHLDYSLCNKEAKQQTTTTHGATTHLKNLDKSKGVSLQCKATTRVNFNQAYLHGQNNNTAQNKQCDEMSSEQITPISSTSKQVSSKSTLQSDISFAAKDGAYTVALPSILSATETC